MAATFPFEDPPVLVLAGAALFEVVGAAEPVLVWVTVSVLVDVELELEVELEVVEEGVGVGRVISPGVTRK